MPSDDRLTLLRGRRDELVEETRALAEKFDGSDFSDDALSRLEDIDLEVQAVDEQISGCERVARMHGRGGSDHVETVGRQSAPAKAVAQRERPLNSAEYIQMLVKAGSPGGYIDPRLARLAPSSWNNESVGPDGGYAVPEGFRNEIVDKVAGEDPLISRTFMVPVETESLKFPKDETTPWGSSGVQAYWEGEGNQFTQSKGKLEQSRLELKDLTALVPVTNNLLEDGSAIEAWLRRNIARVFAYKVGAAILGGNGAGQPLGILNAPATVSVAKVASQDATTFVAGNVVDMYARLPEDFSMSSTVWAINPNVWPQLPTKMNLPGVDTTGTEVSGYGAMLWMPPGGLSGQPYSTLMGLPVIRHQACETLGTVGDVVLADLSQYMMISRNGGPRVDVSMHLYFDYNMSAFRAIFRLDGMPMWSSSIAARTGTFPLSPFVTCATRA